MYQHSVSERLRTYSWFQPGSVKFNMLFCKYSCIPLTCLGQVLIIPGLKSYAECVCQQSQTVFNWFNGFLILSLNTKGCFGGGENEVRLRTGHAGVREAQRVQTPRGPDH